MAGVMAVYNRYHYLEEQRDALNQWAKRIAIKNLNSVSIEVVN